jgi:hypothetical protein
LENVDVVPGRSEGGQLRVLLERCDTIDGSGFGKLWERGDLTETRPRKEQSISSSQLTHPQSKMKRRKRAY